METGVSGPRPPEHRRPPKGRAEGTRALMGHESASLRAGGQIHQAQHYIGQTVRLAAGISDDNRVADQPRPAQSNAVPRPGSHAMRPYFCHNYCRRVFGGKTGQTAGSKDDWDQDRISRPRAVARLAPPVQLERQPRRPRLTASGMRAVRTTEKPIALQIERYNGPLL